MAKRDKLYTVNKWNKPLFEEERRRKLYAGGGATAGFNPFLKTGLAGLRWGYGDTGGIDYVSPVSSLTKQNSLDRTVNTFSQYADPNYFQNISKTWAAPELSSGTSGQGTVKATPDYNEPAGKKTPLIDVLPQTINLSSKLLSQSNLLKQTPAKSASAAIVPSVASSTVTSPISRATASYMASHPEFAKSMEKTAEKIAKMYGTKPAGKGTNFFNTSAGQLGMNIGAAVGGEGLNYLLSRNNGEQLHTTAGDVAGYATDAASAILAATGVASWISPLVQLVGKGVVRPLLNQFGSIKHDNGTSDYIYQLNNENPQGSNEFLVNRQATVGIGPEATYTDGWFTDSGKNWAKRQNNRVLDAYNNYQRKIRNSLANNNWIQMQHALKENAMGGKLRKGCKCNKKAMGGFMPSLDVSTATGWGIAQDMINTQQLKTLSEQDVSTGLGNSFIGDIGSLYATGGNIHINPAHKGQFTAKAKRHGMGVQLFANHVLAHKDKFPASTVRQAVFAKNANTWKKAFGGKLNNGKDKDTREYSFFPGASMYDLGGILQAAGSNWGNVSEINAGGQHETNPYLGVQVGVDPEGTPNLVEEGEVIWNDYVFSNRLKCPKEVCKTLRVGVKKDGFTFAEVAKKLLKESKERPNDPISKKGLEANMQKLEDAQEEFKRKMEAEQAVEQFNNLPPEQQVAIMQQEGEKALDAVAQEQMTQELQNLPPEQQQAIAQQMAMEQALAQGVPQGQPSPEEQAMMQQQMAQQQTPQSNINPQEVLAQAAAMQQQALNGAAFGGKFYALGGDENVNNLTGPVGRKSKSHWERNERGEKVLVPNSKYGWDGFGGGQFSGSGGGASWGEDPTPLMPKKRDWLAIDYKESFNKAYERARKEKKKTFWFDGKEYSTAYNPNLTKEEVEAGNNRYQTKGLLIAPWEHSLGGRLFAEGGMLPEATEEQYQQGQQPTEQAVEQADTEMAKYSDEELQNMIEDYQEAESGEVKVTKGKLARLRKKAEKAERELERRHSQENEEQPQEARQEPSQEEIQAAAQALAQQQMMEGLSQEGMPLEGMSPEQAMMMQQLMGGEQMSPEQMAAMELQQQGNGQYACGGKLYLTGGELVKALGFKSTKDLPFTLKDLGINDWSDEVNPQNVQSIYNKVTDPIIKHLIKNGWNPFDSVLNNPDRWFENSAGEAINWGDAGQFKKEGYNEDILKAMAKRYPHIKYALEHGLKDHDFSKGNVTREDLFKALSEAPEWKETEQYLYDPTNGLSRRLEYIARRRGIDENGTDEKFLNKWNNFGEFKLGEDGRYTYTLKDGKQADFDAAFKAAREDGLIGTMYDVRVPATTKAYRYMLDENGNPTDDILFDTTGYEQVGNPYSYYTLGENGTFDPNINNEITYWRKKANTGTSVNGADGTDDESKYLTVGWKPKTDWKDYMYGALPGLTGLGMMLGRGAPDMSGLDAAVAAYERNTGTMVAPHLTHGLIRPAIIDPRVTENNLNARRLGTNRLLMNTGASPSRGATILANDANTIGQLGQAMINNWKENRAQEQAAAAFNRETATTNANILNQVDQFNAKTRADMASTLAQLKYNAAKENIDQRNAYYAGLLGNVGSIFTGLNEARKQQNNRNERNLLLASGVFGETNPFLEDYYGISKVDPNTGKVVRGYNTGMYYWINPNTGKPEYLKTQPKQPSLAINACGGKIKKSKKRKGYTF